jgi:hypothetical protein
VTECPPWRSRHVYQRVIRPLLARLRHRPPGRALAAEIWITKNKAIPVFKIPAAPAATTREQPQFAQWQVVVGTGIEPVTSSASTRSDNGPDLRLYTKPAGQGIY